MALIFPCKQDIIKYKIYNRIEYNTDYFRNIRINYERIRERDLKLQNKSLEEQLTLLAMQWADSIDDKSRKNINKSALRLVRRFFNIKNNLSKEAGEYYRTYRNLRRIFKGDKDFYISYS